MEKMFDEIKDRALRTISVQNDCGIPLTERYQLSPDVTPEAAGKALTEVLETLGTVVPRNKVMSN